MKCPFFAAFLFDSPDWLSPFLAEDFALADKDSIYFVKCFGAYDWLVVAFIQMPVVCIISAIYRSG